MTDDDQAALAHQQELECRYEEEWQKDYDQWLAVQIAWWRFIDNDPDWIREHS